MSIQIHRCDRCGELKEPIGLCSACHIEDYIFCVKCHHYNHRYTLKAHYSKIMAFPLFLFCIAFYVGGIL